MPGAAVEAIRQELRGLAGRQDLVVEAAVEVRLLLPVEQVGLVVVAELGQELLLVVPASFVWSSK